MLQTTPTRMTLSSAPVVAPSAEAVLSAAEETAVSDPAPACCWVDDPQPASRLSPMAAASVNASTRLCFLICGSLFSAVFFPPKREKAHSPEGLHAFVVACTPPGKQKRGCEPWSWLRNPIVTFPVWFGVVAIIAGSDGLRKGNFSKISNFVHPGRFPPTGTGHLCARLRKLNKPAEINPVFRFSA